MRISDWSSDVCSSDLEHGEEQVRHQRHHDGDDAGATLVFACRMPLLPPQHVESLPAVEDGQRARRQARLARKEDRKIGRASCRERVCQYVSISVGAGTLKKKKNKSTINN